MPDREQHRVERDEGPLGPAPSLDDLDPLSILKMHTRSAAHELKNVLGGLTLYLDLLRDEGGEAVAQLVAELQQSLELGISASRSLMEVAAEAGEADVPVDPRLVLAALQRLVQDTLPPRISLTTSYPEELPTVRCDLVSLYSELGRLLSSAAAVLPGSGTIAIKGESQDAPEAEPGLTLAVAAFSDDASEAQVEAFLSEPLAGDPVRSGNERKTWPAPRPISVPGALACWQMRLLGEGRQA